MGWVLFGLVMLALYIHHGLLEIAKAITDKRITITINHGGTHANGNADINR